MPKNRYTVHVYIGKENWSKLSAIAEQIGVPLATLCRILLTQGLEVGEEIEYTRTGRRSLI